MTTHLKSIHGILTLLGRVGGFLPNRLFSIVVEPDTRSFVSWLLIVSYFSDYHFDYALCNFSYEGVQGGTLSVYTIILIIGAILAPSFLMFLGRSTENLSRTVPAIHIVMRPIDLLR